jgi:predicted DNA-binding protein with PD1-like motif
MQKNTFAFPGSPLLNPLYLYRMSSSHALRLLPGADLKTAIQDYVKIQKIEAGWVLTGGHLMGGSIIYTTAEIILGESKKHRFTREKDMETGYHELRIADR